MPKSNHCTLIVPAVPMIGTLDDASSTSPRCCRFGASKSEHWSSMRFSSCTRANVSTAPGPRALRSLPFILTLGSELRNIKSQGFESDQTETTVPKSRSIKLQFIAVTMTINCDPTLPWFSGKAARPMVRCDEHINRASTRYLR